MWPATDLNPWYLRSRAQGCVAWRMVFRTVALTLAFSQQLKISQLWHIPLLCFQQIENFYYSVKSVGKVLKSKIEK